MEELLEWSFDHLAVLRDKAQGLLSRVETEQAKIRVLLEAVGNELTQFQIRIQMVTMGLAFCSMVSGCACGAPRAGAPPRPLGCFPIPLTCLAPRRPPIPASQSLA